MASNLLAMASKCLQPTSFENTMSLKVLFLRFGSPAHQVQLARACARARLCARRSESIAALQRGVGRIWDLRSCPVRAVMRTSPLVVCACQKVLSYLKVLSLRRNDTESDVFRQSARLLRRSRRATIWSGAAKKEHPKLFRRPRHSKTINHLVEMVF